MSGARHGRRVAKCQTTPADRRVGEEVATTPVIVKLTPNVTDVTYIARAAVRGGADALSLINTINSIVGVDLDSFAPRPSVRGKGSHGGYCGPAVKPIALHLLSAVTGDPKVTIPVSGIGGIASWSDAAEFIALGSGTVQVCTTRCTTDFASRGSRGRLDNWRTSGLSTSRIFGTCGAKVTSGGLPQHPLVASSIRTRHRMRLCWTACEDGAHQALSRNVRNNGGPVVEIIDEACVGCNLCSQVCPVDNCITMKEVPNEFPSTSWKQYSAGKGELAPRSEHFHTANWEARH